MGEKEIVEEAETGPFYPPGGSTTGGGTTTGGGPTTGGGTTPGGQPRTPGTMSGPGGPTTQERPDPCKDLNEQADALLKQLEALHTQNREQTQRALRAFFGDPKSATASGYAHSFTQAKVTEAVVDSNNAVGKTLIDVGLFAIGGWQGLGELGAPAKFTKVANKLFGSGIAGAESVAEAYGKIAVKVLEKAGDAAGYKAGKAGSSVAKTIEKLQSEHPEKWIQGPLGFVESAVRGAVLDALGNWMKSGAMSGDLNAAQAAYADFFAAAVAANVSAAAGLQAHQDLQDLNAKLRAANCPEVPIPDHVFYTFKPTQFGEGAFRGQTGPGMHSHSLESGIDRDWDLFGSVNDTRSLPF
jgi:hypothetical protein